MRFYIIYSVDVQNQIHLTQFQPLNLFNKRDGYRIWEITESGESEYSYLADENMYDRRQEADAWSGWSPGKHRKYVGELTAKEFRNFLYHTGLEAEDVETMGSLTSHYGWIPAISFTAPMIYPDDAILSAYVTPIPSVLRSPYSGSETREYDQAEEDRQLAIWERFQDAVLRAYCPNYERRKAHV